MRLFSPVSTASWRLPLRVEQDRVLRRLELVLGLERGQVLGDGHHHPEDGRDDREDREQRKREPEAELVQPQA